MILAAGVAPENDDQLVRAGTQVNPVLAGRCRGVGAVVRDRAGGILVEPGDAGAFAAALDSLLAAPERRRALGRAAAATVAAEHGIDGAARELDAILRAAAGA